MRVKESDIIIKEVKDKQIKKRTEAEKKKKRGEERERERE